MVRGKGGLNQTPFWFQGEEGFYQTFFGFQRGSKGVKTKTKPDQVHFGVSPLPEGRRERGGGGVGGE